MGALFYIKAERGPIWQGARFRTPTRDQCCSDSECLELFSTIFVGSTMVGYMAALRITVALRSWGFPWTKVDDIVNPYGDSRGDKYESIWIVDLSKNIIIQIKPAGSWFVSLRLARARKLTKHDFLPMVEPTPPIPLPANFTSPYWEVDVGDLTRERPLLGTILSDFAHVWRHLLRRQQSPETFVKLAIAALWISFSEFTVAESDGSLRPRYSGYLAHCLTLPQWDLPPEVLRVSHSYIFSVGRTWFIMAQDPNEGLALVKNYHQDAIEHGDFEGGNAFYAILSLRHIILARGRCDGRVEWTKPEPLFDGYNAASSRAIDLLLWICKAQTPFSKLNMLPVEIQDHILSYAGGSPLAAAQLGCRLGLGSPFSWHKANLKLKDDFVEIPAGKKQRVVTKIFFGYLSSFVAYG